MKMGDKVIVYGYIDGCSYETTGQTNYIIELETGEKVEIPLDGAINVDEIVFKDNIKLKDVIKRIKGFDDGTKSKWTYDILQELGSDFGSKMFHEGYQQGKFEGSWVGNQLKDADKIRQELNKPVVKQFVADWYEENKDDFEFNVWDWIAFRNEPEKLENKEFNYWINDGEGNPIQTLVNMHQFGYTVEKEKRYLVKVKGFDEYECYLNKGLLFKKYFLESKNEIGGCRTKHTRKELEADGFGWVFSCEGIEIEEVTE